MNRYFTFCLFVIAVMLPAAGVAQQTYTIIDNDAPANSRVGTWAIGTWGNIYGPDKEYHTGLADIPDAIFTWSLTLPEGDYEIEFWVNNGGYVDHTHYELSSNGGASTLSTWASQYNVGDGWHNLLANAGSNRFYCNGATTVKVNNSNQGVVNGNIVVADALRFYGPFPPSVPPTPTITPTPLPTMTPGIGDIIVESRSDGLNYSWYAEGGTWADSGLKSTAPGVTATGSRYMSMAFPNRFAKFVLPTPQKPGVYEVYLTWPSGGASTSKAYWRLHHALGDEESGTYVDQTQDQNTWVFVGRYSLNPGYSYVTIGGKSGAAEDQEPGTNCYSDAAKFTGPLQITGYEESASWEVYR